MTDRELMQQALEALILAQKDAQIAEADYAIAALRERLAQPEQELKPWQTEETYDNDGVLIARRMKRGPNCEWEPWLTPPRREWVGLTKEEAKEISLANRPYVVDMVAALEARLKEKNNAN